MAHLEKEKAMTQLVEGNKLKETLNKVNLAIPTEKVMLGSVVITDNGNYYLAIGAGE